MRPGEPLPDALPARGGAGLRFGCGMSSGGHTEFLAAPEAEHAGLGLPKRRRVPLAVAWVAALATRARKLRKVSGGAAGGTGSERLGHARPGAGLPLTFPLLFLRRHVTPRGGRGRGRGVLGAVAGRALEDAFQPSN